MKKYLVILLCSFFSYAENNSYVMKVNKIEGIKVIQDNNNNNETQPIINPVCNNEVFGQCTEGQSQYTSAIGANVVTWNCTINNVTVSCSKTAELGTDGVCGSSNNTTLSSIPTENLCNTGNPSFVTETSTNYNWSCSGSEGSQTIASGNTVNCSGLKPSPIDSIDTTGWLHFANYGMNFYVDDNTWQNAVINMKVGVKIVNQKDGKYSFISAQKLLNASCLKINQVSTLRTATKIFHHEISGCNGTGQDYSTIELKQYYAVYDHARVFDIRHCALTYCGFSDQGKTTGDTKFYIL